MTLIIPETTLTKILFDDLERDGIGFNLEAIQKAKDGDANILFEIGLYYCQHKQNNSKAMAWYQLSANKNYAPAKNNIGNLFREGKGVPVDHHNALKWFIQAARDKNEPAIYNIAESFEKGHGVVVDKMKALEWYSRINTHSPDVTRIVVEGYSLSIEQKEKPFDILVGELEEILEFEEVKMTAITNIEGLQLEAPRKTYKIQIEIQSNDDQASTGDMGRQKVLEAENRTLRDTCKQLNEMLQVLQQNNEFIMNQFEKNRLNSNKRMEQLEYENTDLKSKMDSIEQLLEGNNVIKYNNNVTKSNSNGEVSSGKDNNDLCYDGD